MQDAPSTVRPAQGFEEQFEQHRVELTAYCYRMLASPFEAEDAVQDTFIRAWRGIERFEGRAALRSWLYRIATNVCLDMLGSRERRARPMDLGPAQEPVLASLNTRPDESFVEPIPDALVARGADPAEIAATRDSVRLALAAALHHPPPPPPPAGARDPLRVAPLEGLGGGRAPRNLRRVGEQRAPAGPRDARPARSRRRAAAPPGRGRPRDARSLRRRVRGVRRRGT